MKKALWISLATAGTAAAYFLSRRFWGAGAPSVVDLNSASRRQLLALTGFDEELVDRVIEHRPYRNKLELVSRMVIPDVLYRQVRNRIDTRVHMSENDPHGLTSGLEKVV